MARDKQKKRKPRQSLFTDDVEVGKEAFHCKYGIVLIISFWHDFEGYDTVEFLCLDGETRFSPLSSLKGIRKANG